MTIEGLEDGVEYEFRAVGKVSGGGTYIGQTDTFTTVNDPPVVSTDLLSDVLASGATLEGSLNDLGSANSIDCFFQWRATGASSWNVTATETLFSTGSYEIDISGLAEGIDYEYRAVARASDGDRDTGRSVSFTTHTNSAGPTIDSYSVTEEGSPNPHVDIVANWEVSTTDSDLESVLVQVIDENGYVVDAARATLEGTSAADVNYFKIKSVDGRMFDVTITVVDTAGNTISQSQTVTE
jgi:subtilisin